MFANYVGVSPKWVMRRARLHEAALRADAAGEGVDWAALAADLGYADQAHLTRDFTATLGVPPTRYAARRSTRRSGLAAYSHEHELASWVERQAHRLVRAPLRQVDQSGLNEVEAVEEPGDLFAASRLASSEASAAAPARSPWPAGTSR